MDARPWQPWLSDLAPRGNVGRTLVGRDADGAGTVVQAMPGVTKESEVTGPTGNASSTVSDYVTGSIGDLRALVV